MDMMVSFGGTGPTGMAVGMGVNIGLGLISEGYESYNRGGFLHALNHLDDLANPFTRFFNATDDFKAARDSGDDFEIGDAFFDFSLEAINVASISAGGVKGSSHRLKICSFVEDTQVLMCDGSTRPIENVREGDWVLAMDTRNGNIECQQVSDPYRNENRILMEVSLSSGETITTTPNHPFYVKGSGFVRVDQLLVGDELASADETYVTVEGVHRAGVSAVYNFGVSEHHNYFVGTKSPVLVHNCFPFDSVRGRSHRYFRKHKPRNWKETPADSGKGWKWIDPTGIERFRFMRPNKNSKFPRDRNGSIRWKNADDKFLDADGYVVKKTDESFDDLTHIPYDGIWP